MGAAFVVPVCLYVTVPFELSPMKSVGCAVLKMKSLLSLHQLSIIAGAMLAVFSVGFSGNYHQCNRDGGTPD